MTHNFFQTQNFFGPNVRLGLGDFHWTQGIKQFQAEHFRLKSCFYQCVILDQHIDESEALMADK